MNHVGSRSHSTLHRYQEGHINLLVWTHTSNHHDTRTMSMSHKNTHNTLKTMYILMNFTQHNHHLSSMFQHYHNMHNLLYPLHPPNHQPIDLSVLNQLKTMNHLKRKEMELHRLIQTTNKQNCLVLLRSYNRIVCHPLHDQRELGTAQLTVNIILYHQYSNQDWKIVRF